MTSEEVTVRLDPEAARIYREADDRERMKLQWLLSWRIRQFKQSPNAKEQLMKIMDELSEKARERGITPEILESILNEPE